jgi:hypothetical protein
MANRREFLQSTLAVSALPLVSGAALAPFSASATPIARVVYDERLPASRAFAERTARSGIPAHGFKGDITSLWFNDLHRRWVRKPEAVAGLTEAPALFCLERLAWDYKMRVIFLAEHRAGELGGITHTISTPGKLRAADLDAAGARWAQALAGALIAPHGARTPIFGASSVGIARHESDRDRPLVSWVIAPAGAARAS